MRLRLIVSAFKEPGRLISLFSVQTGAFKSSLVVPLADILNLLPENPAGAFLDFLRTINSSV
jgi:hypothetical protein